MLIPLNYSVWYGPQCAAAIGLAVAAGVAELHTLCRIGGIAISVAYSPKNNLTNGRRADAHGQSTSLSLDATARIKIRITAIGKVNALSQQDITAALFTQKIEGNLTFIELLRIWLAQFAGDAENINGPSPQFKSLDGTKTRLAGTITGGTRTITTRDGQ
jgi:hypothetical protein